MWEITGNSYRFRVAVGVPGWKCVVLLKGTYLLGNLLGHIAQPPCGHGGTLGGTSCSPKWQFKGNLGNLEPCAATAQPCGNQGAMLNR